MENRQASAERAGAAGEALEVCRETGLRRSTAAQSFVLPGSGSSNADKCCCGRVI